MSLGSFGGPAESCPREHRESSGRLDPPHRHAAARENGWHVQTCMARFRRFRVCNSIKAINYYTGNDDCSASPSVVGGDQSARASSMTVRKREQSASLIALCTVKRT